MAKQVEIGIKIKADGKEFAGVAQLSRKELDQLNRSAKNTNSQFARMERGAASLKSVVAGLGVALGGIASVGALKSVIDDMDQIGKLSTRLGVSTEALSELSHAAELSGVRFETLTMGLQRMERRIGQVALTGKGEAKAALDALGLSAQKLANIPLDQTFEVIADRLIQVEGAYQRTALAQKIFDSEGVALIQTMHGGAEAIRAARTEAHAMGLTFSQEMAEGAAQANDNLTRFRGTIRGLTVELTNDLLPAVNDVAEGLLSLLNPKQAIQQGLLNNISDLTEQMNKLTDSFFSVSGGGNQDVFAARMNGISEELERAKKAAMEFGATEEDIAKAMAGTKEVIDQATASTGVMADVTLKSAAATETKTKAVKSLKKELTEQEKLLKRQAEIQEQEWKSSVDLVNSYHEQIDALQVRIDTFGMTNEELSRYNRMLLETQLREDDVEESIINTTLALYDQKAALEQVAAEQEAAAANSGGSFFGDLEDNIGKIDLRLDEAFSGWILGQKSFSDAIVDIWAQMFGQILNLAVKFITDRIMTQLFSGAGWISSLAAAIGIAIYGVLKSGPASASRPDPSRTTTSGDPRAPGFDAIVTGDVLARDQVFLLDSQTATNLNIQLSIAADQLSMFSGQIADFALELFDLQALWNSVSLGFIDTLASVSPELASFFSGGVGPIEIAMDAGGVAVLDSGSSSSSNFGEALGQLSAVASVLGAAYTIYSLVDNWDDMTSIQKAMGALSALSAVLNAISVVFQVGIQVIPIIGWVIAAIIQILEAVQSFQSGNWIKGVSQIFGGHLGGILADEFFPPDEPDVIFRTSNDTISEVPKGTATTLGGGIGVESMLGVTTAAVRNVNGQLSDDQVLEMFGPILEAIAQVDNELARSLNRMDQGLTLGLFKEALGNIGETSVETVQDLEDLEVADFIRERYHQIFNLLGQTGTEVGVAMDEWFDVLDGVFGAEFTLGVVAILASSIGDLMAIPNELVHFMDDRLKSGKVGGTPEDGLMEIQDVLLSYELLKQGFESLDASIDDTTIIQFLANMTEIGFATKDAAIGVLAYATALKGANQDLNGEELGQAIVQGVQDLIDYANSMQLTNAQLSALIGTFAQFAGVFNELGLEYVMDDLFVLSGMVDTLARESQDAALEVEGASQAIQEFGAATGEALAQILNETLFFARWIETAGGAASRVGVSGLEFVEAARQFVAGFDNMEAATTAFNDYLTAFFSDAEIARMQQQWANDALQNFVQANTQFSGIDPRNIPSELWIDPLIKSFLQLAGAAKKADDAVNGLSESSKSLGGAVPQSNTDFHSFVKDNITDPLGENALTVDDRIDAVNLKFDEMIDQLWDLGVAAGMWDEVFKGSFDEYVAKIEKLRDIEINDILNDPGGISEWAQAVNEFGEMAAKIGRSDFENQLADIGKEFDEWRDKARELFPGDDVSDIPLSEVLKNIRDVEQQVIDMLVAERQAARDALLLNVNDQFFIESVSDFQGGLAQLALGFLDTLQQMADLGGGMKDFNAIMDVAMKTGTKRLTEYMQQIRDEFDAIFDRIEGASKGIQKNIDQLLGVGVEQQLAAAYAELGTAEGVDEQIAIIQEIQSLIMQRYQDEVGAIGGVTARVEDLKKLVDSLRVDDRLSPLSNEGRLNEARAQYSTLLAAAQAGDIDAINELGSAATEYLTEARNFFASSKDYAQIFDAVTGALSGFGELEPGFDDDIDAKTLASQQESVDELRSLQRLLDDLMEQQRGQLEEELDTAHKEAIFIADEFARRAKEIIAGSKSDADAIAGSVGGAVFASGGGVEGAIGQFAGANIARLDAINRNLVELGIDPLMPATLEQMRTLLAEVDGLLVYTVGNQLTFLQHIFNSTQDVGVSVRNGNQLLRDILRQMGGTPSTSYVDEYQQFAGGGIANEPSIFGEAGLEAAVPIPNGFIPARVYGQTESPETTEQVKRLNETSAKIEQQLDLLNRLTAENTEQLEQIKQQSKRQANAQSKMAEEAALQ